MTSENTTRREPQPARGASPRRRGKLRLAGIVALLLCALSFLPIGPTSGWIATASAHALLVRADPAPDSIAQSPPSRVRMWFSEDLNAQTSRAVVVDTANREVDLKNSKVSSSDHKEMDVGLPLLPAGTYVVAWRTQSAIDGHVVGGSFIFRVARPDGSVPPIPAKLPAGHIPGAGGSGASPSAALDPPTLAQALMTWLALLFMTFWVGGLIWETWILPRSLVDDSDVRAGAEVAGRRFARLAPWALAGVIVADIGIVLTLSVQLAGSWSGAVSLPFLRAIVLDSRFGVYWLWRQAIALAALALLFVASRRGWSFARERQPETRATGGDASSQAIAPWHRELLAVLRDVRSLPRRLVRGWMARTWAGRALCVLGAGLVVAFALSGHAAAVPASEFAYAFTVDLFHLFANAAWVGGLLYISVVFIPAIQALPARSRARILAIGLPAFGALAITCATLLAATGTLNTTIHLTSIKQFLTTSYGRVLAVKIEFFLFMVAISAYHAFVLRPRLAHALRSMEAARGLALEAERVESAVGASITSSRGVAAGEQITGLSPDGIGGDPSLSPRAAGLAARLEDWLVRESLIGAVILLCVALLAAFAGSLAPAMSSAAPAMSSGGAFVQTQHAQGYAITLKVTPATFGTNTFTVSVADPSGKPLSGGSVLINTQMLDMDMGVQSAQLKEVGASQPGVYSGQSDLTMAGHWRVLVKVLPPGAKDFIVAAFTFSATY